MREFTLKDAKQAAIFPADIKVITNKDAQIQKI